MSLDADCELTYWGREAANHISRVMNNHGPDAARNTAREEYDWTPLGTGIARAAFRAKDNREQIEFEIPGGRNDPDYVSDPDDCVIKVSVPHNGQMMQEVRQWKLISGQERSDEPWEDLEPVVAPVKDYDKAKHRWLTMPRGDTENVTARDTREVTDFAEKKGFFMADVYDANIALFNGEPRVIDLGQEFHYTGYTEPERWDEHRDTLERIGCRDVYSQTRGRLYREWYWRSPLRLPGLPYETDESVVKYSKGGSLKNMELYGTVIPADMALDIDVANALDETLDINSAFRSFYPEVDEVDGDYLPKISSSHVSGGGLTLSEMETFIVEWYDAYDTVFAEVFDVDEYEPPEPDPPEYEGSSDILGQIEGEFPRE